MKKRLTALVTAFALCAAIAPQAINSNAKAEEVWKPNPINVREKLDRGLVAMQTDDGVYLSWRLQADEDSVYGTGNGNVSFDIYRDGEKIATESYSTNYIDYEGTAQSEYQVVRTGTKPADDDTANVAVPFSSGSNYFDIELEVPAPVTFPSDIQEEEEDAEEDTTVTGEEENTSEATATGQHPYTVGDTSVGDLDGDGEYELVVKWDCSPKDNSHQGYSGNVILSAYELTGEHMWDIDLGPNIRSGAHYTQFLVYDFDGDGKAEITCKTAPGSKDGKKEYVTKAAKNDEDIKAVTDDENEISYVSKVGRILTGDEYFTIFDGKTGAALDTIYYPNQRLAPSIWGDSDTYGNRVDRFTAAVAYLDGVKPYAVYMRGYYYGQGHKQRQAACAVSFNGTELNCKYSFDTYDVNQYQDPSGYTTSSFYKKPYSARNYKGVLGYEEKYKEYFAQGNHNCTVADVDGDGRDEVLTGAMCYHIDENDNLRPLWSTFKGHGDALHIGDYDPTHDGYEFFVVHEEGGGGYDHGTLLDYGMSVIDPGVPTYNETGAAPENIIMYHKDYSGDTGRGMMTNVGSGGYYQFWGAGIRMSAGGTDFRNSVIPSASSNFRIYWDGDLYEELLDGTGIRAWNESKLSMDVIFRAEGCTSINGTKSVPALSADLFGDWREEVVFPTSDNTKLRVYTTDIYTEHKMKSLMYDNVYRCSVAAEQTGYNQPPHIGYYLDPKDNAEGKVDAAPEVKIPAGITPILHQGGEDSEIASYYNSLPEDIDGISVGIGGGSDQKDKTKYFAVMNQGLTNRVFKMQNGDYANKNRAVTVSFTDKIKTAVADAIENGKYSELTFAVKLFNGTNDTKGGLHFLRNTTGNSRDTDYANKIATITTDTLPEGEWGIVRYEFTGSGYNLYLNDEKLASGTTTEALPILAMPFTNTNTYGAYTSMIFDDIFVYAIDADAAPTPAPTATPAPTEKPLGAAPEIYDSVATEDFEGDTNIFSSDKVTTDTATKGRNETKILRIEQSRASSEAYNIGKTKTYIAYDFRIEPTNKTKSASITLRNENNKDMVNLAATSSTGAWWGTITLNGEDITSTAVTDKSYSGWENHQTTGWIRMYSALDFEKQQAEVSLIRLLDNSVVYEGTLDFLNPSTEFSQIYLSIPTIYGSIWLDNVDIAKDKDAEITDLVITPPEKTTYFTGEEFDAEGLAVTAEYSDDTSYKLTEFDYTVSEPDMTKAGTKEVTVTFDGKQKAFNITVNDEEITTLSVLSAPSKTRYLKNENLDPAGLVLRADYDDGSYEIVSDGYSLSPFDSSATGEKTITATYGGKTAAFSVEVVTSLNIDPTPTPTARPTPTPRPAATDDPNATNEPEGDKTAIYTMDVSKAASGRVTQMVTEVADADNANVPDFGTATDYTAAVKELDGWGYKHVVYSKGGLVNKNGNPQRQTTASIDSSENTFYVQGDGTCSGGTISFIPANKNDLAIKSDGIDVYDFTAVVTTTGQNQAGSPYVGFTSSPDGSEIASVSKIALAASGSNNVERTYRIKLVNDKKNGKYYVYQDGFLIDNGASEAITGIFAQTVNKYIKIGIKDLTLSEQTKLPVAVDVIFRGNDNQELTAYNSVLAETSVEAPAPPIIQGKTFDKWLDASGAVTTEFKAGYKKTVYKASYTDGSTIASVNAYTDKFAKITLTPQEGETIEGYTDIYGIATFKNISHGIYSYKILKDGYETGEGGFTLEDDDYDLEEELEYDASHTGYLYYEADWAEGAKHITDGSASGFTTDLGPVNVRLPKSEGVANVFDVTVKAKAETLNAEDSEATWLLNSDKGNLLGLHWVQGDGIYAITGWNGSAVPKNSTDTLGKADNKLKIAEAANLTAETTVSFSVDSVSETIVVSVNNAAAGSLPMVNGASSLNTMSAGVTNSKDDIYIYSLAVTKPEDDYMAIAGDTAVAKISGKTVTRQYERSEAKLDESESFTWSIEAPAGAAANAVTIDQNGLVKISDTATAGEYTIKCESTNKSAELKVEIKDFQPLTLTADGPEICDFRGTGEIKYQLTSAADTLGTDVLDLIPSPEWSVSDTKIASIDKSTGVLTMNMPGTVTVTATVNNGGVKSTVSVNVEIVNYYIIADATMNTTIINIASLADENVTGYQVTTATASGGQKSKYTVDKASVTNESLTIDTTGADKVEIAPIFSVSDGIAYADERYALYIPADTYDISVTASGQRADIYANSQMLVNNMLQHGSAAATETRHDIKVSSSPLTIRTADYATDLNALWTKVTGIKVVKSPSIVQRKPKMYVLGDSLVAKYYNGGSADNSLARSGWGQVLNNYISDDIEVVPLGNSGTTAADLYNSAFSQIKESGATGDYLILESGYNDKSRSSKAEMREVITAMYNQAAANGVKVILVSPNASYHDYTGTVAWTTYMEEFAKELNAEYIDLAQLSYDFLSDTYGSGYSDVYTCYNVDDKLHSTYNGAQKWASLVAQGLYDLGYKDIVNTEYSYTFSDGTNEITAKVIPDAPKIPELTAPIGEEDLVYTGGILTLLKTQAQTTGGTLEYSLDNEHWFSDISDITAVDAGEYTIYYKAIGDDKYEDSETESIKVTIAKAEQAAPAALIATATTSEKASDGTISGVTEGMEYRVKGGVYAAVTGTNITELAAGDYEVRYATDENHNAGTAAEVQVNLTISGTITWNYAYSYTTEGGNEHSGTVPDDLEQRSATAKVELLNRGAVYKTTTVNAAAAVENTADGTYKFTDVPVSIDGAAASYSIRITPLVADDGETEQTINAENYSVTFTDAGNRNAAINYNPNCFDAEWTVNIENIDTIEGIVPDTVFVKVLYGTTETGAENGEYDGYAVITQQVMGNGTACPLTENSGTYTATGKYPVWRYQPDGSSYFHKAMIMGYTVNGVYIDCRAKNYISEGYMRHSTDTDKADRDMEINIESLPVPVVEFNANGGTIENGHILVSSYGTAVTAEEISAKAAEWENHTFEGWYNAANGGDKVTEINGLTGKTTLYAQWKENQSVPTGIAALKATSDSAADGSVTGVNYTMEYSTDNGASWTAVAIGKTIIENLAAGNVLIRYAETLEKNAGESITVTVGVKKNQSKPTGITATGATSESAKDGQISGLTDKMEYRKVGGGEFAAISETALEGLSSGEYEIRYKGDENYNAGESVTVSVGYALRGTITWHYDYSYYTGNSEEPQSGVVPNTISQRSRTARVELINKGETYRTVTVSAAAVDEKTANAEYMFKDIPSSINGEKTAYSVNIIPLIAERDTDAVQQKQAESYSVTSAGEDNLNANIYYNPNCFDATWTVTIKNIDAAGGALPDAVYVKVLYGTTAEGAENGQYDGYAVITQQESGNGVACTLTKNSDGTYTAKGSYPVWKYQPNGTSYYHKAILTGYTLNGAYIDCTEEKYISEGYMRYNSESDKADKDMAVTVEILELPNDAPLPVLLRDDIAVKSAREENGGIKLIIDTKQSGPETINLFTAVYNSDKSLKSVGMTPCAKDTNGKITVLLTEPQIANGESYKLMLWDNADQSPIIKAIGDSDNFFEN